MNLSIRKLAESPEYFEDVFQALYSNWGNNNPNYWRSWVRSCMSSTGIPVTYIVLLDEQFVGTFSLWLCDLQSCQNLSPWLGGIVVLEKYRGQGIGLFIQQRAKEILKTLNINKAFLFTDLIGFYEKSGWVYSGEVFDEKDKKVRLYELVL